MLYFYLMSCLCDTTMMTQLCRRMLQIGSTTVLFSIFALLGVWCNFVTGGPNSATTQRSIAIPAGAKSECEDGDTACIKEWLEKEAIGVLHRQIDDDHNGNVDLSESDEFIRDELQYKDDFDRHNVLHRDDKFISVEDLWMGWKHSEVYNWSVEQTVHWLCEFVELPQYSETFQNNAIEGAALPRLAVNSAQFMTAILGISNPIDRQKISLKAMDVVLFGPPKPIHSYLKDWMLVVSLVVAVGGCWFAYAQHRYCQSHIKEMLKEMEGLQKAEDTLREMQEKLEKAQEQHKSAVMEKQNIEKILNDEISRAKAEAERLHVARNQPMDGDEWSAVELAEKLKLAEEELVQVRNALDEAERQLESGGMWVPPQELLDWLQVTHEMEAKFHTVKRLSAERQLRDAKDVCDKIRKKRTTFMGSFRIAHGSTLDEVDHRIVKARSALMEVTNEIQERGHRWSQIEALCRFQLTRSPSGSFSSVLQTDSISISSGVVGSAAQLETNPPMGIEEVDEDFPPPPHLYKNVTAGGIPHSLTQSNIWQSVDQLSTSSPQAAMMRQSQSVSSLQGFSRQGSGSSQGSLRSRISPTSTTCNGVGFSVGNSPIEEERSSPKTMTRSMTQPLAIPTSSSSKVLPSRTSPTATTIRQRPKSLPVSQSETSLEYMKYGTLPNGKKKKDLLKKSPAVCLDDDEASRYSDNTESEDGKQLTPKKRGKLHLRIPKFPSHSNKNETVKTC